MSLTKIISWMARVQLWLIGGIILLDILMLGFGDPSLKIVVVMLYVPLTASVIVYLVLKWAVDQLEKE